MKGCRPLDEAEIIAVLAKFHGPVASRDRALFLLGLRSGFRISELLSLRLGDVFIGGQITDRVSVRRSAMKKHLEGRTVPLHNEAKEALRTWIMAYLGRLPGAMPGLPLFPRRPGGIKAITRAGAWYQLKQAFHRAGLFGPGLATHSMRKTFAARVYQRLGKDLIKTQQAMGHRSINSTARYLSFADAEIDKAILAA